LLMTLIFMNFIDKNLFVIVINFLNGKIVAYWTW